MMKKIIILIVTILIAALIYRFISQPSNNISTTVEPTPKVVDEDIEKLDFPELDDKALLLDEDENLTLGDMDKDLKEEVPEVEPEIVASVHDIMVESDVGEIEKNFASKEGITPLIGIEVFKNSITNLKVGDIVSLPYMGAGEYEAKISTKTTHANGSVSVTGNLTDEYSQYSVVLTEGKNTTFGTVTTPDGAFEIETKDGQGYVYSTDAIDNKWIDYTKTDTLHPEH